ncbi:MAG: restriction endonuclease subunit S [Ruminococcus sp.]|nr:restriction endonuclease subunit S [Ruminococcus sp.]
MNVALKELGEISTGNTPSKKISEYYNSDDIYFVKPDIISDKGISIISKSNEYISENARAKARIVEANSIFVTCIGTIGKIGITSDGEYAFNQQINAIKTNDKIIPKYLAYNLLFSKPKLIDIANAPVVPIINKTQFGDFIVHIEPNIDIQLKIVSILDKLQSIITHRQIQLTKLDELVKARFVEMFGDPILNQKGFPVYRMDEVVDFQGGSQPDKKYFEYEPTDDNIRLIQIRDYKTDRYITYIPKAMAKRFCTADDIMIGRYGPPIFQILQGIEGSFNVALMKATPKMGNKEFIRYFLKQDCLLHYLEGLSQRTAGQDGIQMDKLKAYPFPMPPIEAQEAFASFTTQINKSKAVIQKSLDKSQMLFDSLMQEYFGG